MERRRLVFIPLSKEGKEYENDEVYIESDTTDDWFAALSGRVRTADNQGDPEERVHEETGMLNSKRIDSRRYRHFRSPEWSVESRQVTTARPLVARSCTTRTKRDSGCGDATPRPEPLSGGLLHLCTPR